MLAQPTPLCYVGPTHRALKCHVGLPPRPLPTLGPGLFHKYSVHLVKQMVHEGEGGKELRESEGTHGIFEDKDWLWAMKEFFPRGMPISKGMGA